MIELDAYLEGVYYGRFAEGGHTGELVFTYDESAPATPISLSIPRDGRASRSAATNLLDNLLPDRAEVRERMKKSYGAAGADTLSLLAAAGGDIAGGLVLVPAGADLRRDQPLLDPALDMDVAERIAAIKRDPDAWTPAEGPARFSLAGSQGKFALADYEGEWYWSNRTMPSTHIIKPAAMRLPGLEQVEADTLALASTVGLPAAKASLLHMLDQQAFIVERFDRAPTGTVAAQRIHAEDLAQASGTSAKRKYDQTAKQTIELLRAAELADPDIEYDFLRQLAFNTIIGNADAHAKNYSVMLRPDRISLAPLYDAVPVILYPEYDQNLAMEISGARRPSAVSLDHWRKLARSTGLDIGRVEHEIRTLAAAMNGAIEDAWPSIDPIQRNELLPLVKRNLLAAISDTATPRAR
ncbi:HipA domain-containing protein [Alpinimonas psychrophila]|uniref:Serine/threonine-protein kinase HipA n=1 Tax=Alpinimonas psychrophila TaxID=748908 RepID=A0A7W3JUM0_9MICO|nr:serine/threonine-protein kinase HipA [Alpinimonas psychrophila]